MALHFFRNLYFLLEGKGYFQEAFGFDCVDEGPIPGTLGPDIEAQMFRRLRKADLWPIGDRCSGYSEDDLFDVIEFTYDCISKPLKGNYHSHSNCGWHYSEFDRDAGRATYRTEINDIICDYDSGYELSEDGEILSLAEDGLSDLMDEPLPTYDPENVETRVQAAIRKFRRYRSSQDDKRDAIRDLADVLEFMRRRLRGMLTSKDDADLFNIANNFGIRHHNQKQKTDYNKAVWYNWMFYYYLATIHASIALLKREEPAPVEPQEELPF